MEEPSIAPPFASAPSGSSEHSMDNNMNLDDRTVGSSVAEASNSDSDDDVESMYIYTSVQTS